MRNRSTVILLALSVALPSSAASAEDTPQLLIGLRVRVTATQDDGDGKRGTRRLVGDLVRFDEQTIGVQDGNNEMRSVPRSAVVRLERSRGRRTRGKWARNGFLAGALAGGVLGYAAGESCHGGEFLCFDRSATIPALGLLGGAAGALVGALAAHGEHWDVISTSRTKVTLAPTTNGVGARLSVRF